MIDIQGLYGSLLDASWRGITFQTIDTSTETGRRLVRTLFPGLDIKASQDLGALDGAITINGLFVGDDYTERQRRLEQAFRTPGPGLLVDPWLGQVLVIATQPARFTFSQTELRVCRFTATFERWFPNAPQPPDTLTALIDALEDLKAEARATLAAILAPVALTLAAIGAVQSFCSQVAGVFDSVVGTDNDLAAAAGAPVAALRGVTGLPADATYATAVTAVLAAPSAAVAGTSASQAPSAIGPGDQAPTATPLDARVSSAALISALTGVLSLAPTAPVLSLAAGALIVGDLASAAADIAYQSQEEAETWRATLIGGVDALADAATRLAADQPAAAAGVWNAAQTLRAAIAADINAAIGRLPAVRTLTLPEVTPAWVIAQGLAGDTPARLRAVYADLLARNGVVHPALMGPGEIEALVA